MSHRCLPVLITLTCTLSACGGGGLGSSSASSSSGSNSTPTAAGIWNGTDSASGLALTGIINSAGVADFIRSDGAQYTGTAQVQGSALAITLDVTTQFGTGFSDGSNSAIGTFNGTISTGVSISGSVSLTTSANSTISSSWSLTFNPLYNNTSSIADVSANYADSSTGDPLDGSTWSISGAGAVTAQSGTTGCVMADGQIATADTTNDAYEISYTLQSCGGAEAVLNGVAFTGLAVLNGSQIVVGVTGENTGGAHYGITSGLTKS
jgi:hypothetical protein